MKQFLTVLFVAFFISGCSTSFMAPAKKDQMILTVPPELLKKPDHLINI